MEKYFEKKPRFETLSQVSAHRSDSEASLEDYTVEDPKEDININDLVIGDPGLGPKIFDYDAKIREQVRREYWLKGPCQPHKHKFPGDRRRFVASWFKEFDWLEYSISYDAAYCLCCYLYKIDRGDQGGGEAFVTEGFRSWNKKDRLKSHQKSNEHNAAREKCKNLMNVKSHIETSLHKQSVEGCQEYHIRLTAIIDVTRFLLSQGLPFRGHDESENSENQGNFLELLKFLGDHNEEIQKVILKNAPKNLQHKCPLIQKDVISVIAKEIREVIANELRPKLFSILVDESRDISVKEQMAVVLRYVDRRGYVVERFFAIIHVPNTSAASLKGALDNLFSNHGLSFSSLRGQGYDGASNMQGDLNGLKALILRENSSAFSIHCFAHQLQLTLIAVAKKDVQIAFFFSQVASLINIVGGSCKRQDLLKQIQRDTLTEELECGNLVTGQGQNQETSLKRAGDTRWGSHYNSLQRLILMFSSTVKVVEFVKDDGSSTDQKAEAYSLFNSIQDFDFSFNLHLMRNVLGMTYDLSQALQKKKDQNIINALKLVSISKKRLQMFRDNGWDKFLEDVIAFCNKHEINVPKMDDQYVAPGRSRRNTEQVTILHHYRVGLFCAVIDLQLIELNDCFNEANTELLLYMTCLDPSDNFSAFNKSKLVRFAQFYPDDFPPLVIMELDNQLEDYILDMRSSEEFKKIASIGELSIKLVEFKKDITYHLVYLLVELALLLPVATATVERAFSAMNIVKTRLRNRLGDELMEDSLLTYIERGIMKSIDNDTIINRFQKMKRRR